MRITLLLMTLLLNSPLTACWKCDEIFNEINMKIYKSSQELYYAEPGSEKYFYLQGENDALSDMRDYVTSISL